jgi:hypothetical protein
MEKTTIFYENSHGFIAQWAGEILEVTETTISIRFSKSKALKFDLKVNSGFCIVTKTKMKDQKLGIDSASSAFSQDESLRNQIIELTKGNVLHHWTGNKFEK